MKRAENPADKWEWKKDWGLENRPSLTLTMKKLYLAVIKPHYQSYLQGLDCNIPDFSRHEKAYPIAGLILPIDDFLYFVPLTYPKEKYARMKNRLDFAKIADGQYGALNFNNMFAVSKTWLEPLDLKITEKDSLAQKQYKNLLKNQIRWCISNAQQIYKKASKLRKFYNKKRLPKPFLDRCCNFPNSEKNVEHFIQESEESL